MICRNRPETPGFFTPCPGGWGNCPCGKEVRAAIEAGELLAGDTIETPAPPVPPANPVMGMWAFRVQRPEQAAVVVADVNPA